MLELSSRELGPNYFLVGIKIQSILKDYRVGQQDDFDQVKGKKTDHAAANVLWFCWR